MGANPFGLHLHVQLSLSPALLNAQVWHAELSLTSNHSHYQLSPLVRTFYSNYMSLCSG